MTRASPARRTGERDGPPRGHPVESPEITKSVDATTRAQLGAFFDRFAAAFVGGDLLALAGCYVTPVMFVTEWDSTTLDSAHAIAEGFRHVVSEHRSRGVVSLSHRIETLSKPAPRLVEVGIRWTFNDSAGHAMLHDRYRYLLRLVDDEGLRINVVVVLGGAAVPTP
jgi:hypothetical protein